MKPTIEILLEFKGEIAQTKEDIKEQTNSPKYDDWFDDLLKSVDAFIARLEYKEEEE